jgi:hypothetical protein
MHNKILSVKINQEKKPATDDTNSQGLLSCF